MNSGERKGKNPKIRNDAYSTGNVVSKRQQRASIFGPQKYDYERTGWKFENDDSNSSEDEKPKRLSEKEKKPAEVPHKNEKVAEQATKIQEHIAEKIDEPTNVIHKPKAKKSRKRHINIPWTRKSFKDKILDTVTAFDTKIAQEQQDPYCYCIIVSLALIPIFLLVLIWDTLSILVFEIPHYSTHDSPGFLMAFQFSAFHLALYGYMMEYMIWVRSQSVLWPFLSIGNLILLMWRLGLEFFFDGYRSQHKLYFTEAVEEQPT